MGSPGESSDRSEVIRLMLDRLCAPDLTLSEAKELVPNLSQLLDGDRRTPDRSVRGSCRSTGGGLSA